MIVRVNVILISSQGAENTTITPPHPSNFALKIHLIILIVFTSEKRHAIIDLLIHSQVIQLLKIESTSKQMFGATCKVDLFHNVKQEIFISLCISLCL